jgi:hypothetical protein
MTFRLPLRRALLTVALPVALPVALLGACAPQEEPPTGPECALDTEVSLDVGVDDDELDPLADGDTLTVSDDGSGQLTVDLRVRVDGLSPEEPTTTLSVYLYGAPNPPDDASIGDDGQPCIAEGAAKECANLDLRCVADICRFLVGNSFRAETDLSCEDDDALHQRGITTRLVENTTAEEFEGFETDVVVSLETTPSSFEEKVIRVNLDVAGVD